MMVYLDNNATTPLSEQVKKSITNHLGNYGNPSSLYNIGQESKRLVTEARKSVAQLIGAKPDQILFTGCATESNNAVINSCVDRYEGKAHIITTCVEHSAVLETAKYYMKHRGTEITFLSVDGEGRIDPNELVQSIKPNTVLVSIMLVNNEIGNIYPVKVLCSMVHQHNPEILFHTDATQAVGKMLVDVEELGVDYLTMSGHKFYAPKGIGALYIKNRDLFLPFLRGGHQERGLRAGTENLLSIVAMGEAAKEAMGSNDFESIAELRDYIEKKIIQFVRPSRVIGDVNNRICNTSCILLENYDGSHICDIIGKLPKESERVMISAGSACNSEELEPSHVMKALKIDKIPIRISLGRNTTKTELDVFLRSLMKTVNMVNRL